MVYYIEQIQLVVYDILDIWFNQRVEFKNEMKKYGKEGNKEKYEWYKNVSWFRRFYLTLYMGC